MPPVCMHYRERKMERQIQEKQSERVILQKKKEDLLQGDISSAMAKYNGKNALLPPKSPCPSKSPSYVRYIPSSAIGSKTPTKSRDGNSQHQRTSYESFLIEDQPSWLDELLDEPDTPVQRGGHRRSLSDSFAYTDFTNVGSMNYIARDDNKYFMTVPISSWGSHDFATYRDSLRKTSHLDLNPCGKTKNKPPAVASLGLPSPRGNNVKPFSTSNDTDRNPSLSTVRKQDVALSGPQYPKRSTEKKDFSEAKPSKTETKLAKQKFAQRSRVRKLQYIAELERNVHALQVEGCEVFAEFGFLNRQNIILSLENKALKQHLDSLSQERLIKYLEYEVLEKEVGRLRNMFQQQQQQQTSFSPRCANSRDLDQQFSKLSLKLNEATTAGLDSFHM